jgi:hypothetical protein
LESPVRASRAGPGERARDISVDREQATVAPALKESDEPAVNARLNRVEVERLGALMAALLTRVVFPEAAARWALLVLGQTRNDRALHAAESVHRERMTE